MIAEEVEAATAEPTAEAEQVADEVSEQTPPVEAAAEGAEATVDEAAPAESAEAAAEVTSEEEEVEVPDTAEAPEEKVDDSSPRYMQQQEAKHRAEQDK